MELRTATVIDIPQLVQMRLAYLAEEHGGILPEHNSRLEEELPVYFQKKLNQGILAYVAEEGDEIVSTALMVVIERPGNPHFLSGKTGLLLNVYTKPLYRRQGLAGRLVTMALAEAKKLDLAYVELNATAAGYPLYKKLGFDEEQSRYVRMKYPIQE